MKKRIIKTLSTVIMTATLFTLSTGFTTMAAPVTETLSSGISVSIDNSHANNTVCGTHRTQIYGEWSDDYKVDSYTFINTWYTVRERKRTVYEVCTDCQRVINTRTEYQHRSYAFGIIPMEDWYNV